VVIWSVLHCFCSVHVNNSIKEGEEGEEIGNWELGMEYVE
jgi:hypothetical protein